MLKIITAFFVFQVFGYILPVASDTQLRPKEASDALSTRIVGGEDAPEHLAPWQVSLRTINSNFHFCGGAIVGSQLILTAAHCMEGFTEDSIIVVVGTNHRKVGGDRYKLRSIIVHEGFNQRTFTNDICVIKVLKDIRFSARVQPIRLPDEDTGAGETVLATGWGKLSGDSGGPLVANRTMVGVVSWIIPCAVGFPDVFTRVYHYRGWIQRKISDSK